jgi:hypothetical protein
MSYQGRSPINDVVRSVVMSAAMISPTLLAACGGQAEKPPTPPEPLPNVDRDATATADPTTPDSGATPVATAAPSDDVVRPRPTPTGTGRMMPTRGFAGAARARG